MPAYRRLFTPVRRLWPILLLAAVALFSCAAEPKPSRQTELRETLRRLHTTARLMHTTAHPDDEDGAMLTLEARGKGASVVLFTLNRGEGGQNKMGRNLLDGLGVLRTLELLAADQYYGVEQRFSRVADFGFSKNPDETFQKWHGHDTALEDMVRVIRTFRPDVLVSRFQGTARDGHGHHSAAGLLTREAFRAAADPQRFPEQIKAGLPPWQPKKLYIDNVRPPETSTLELNTGAVDPLLGMSYAQYAMQGLKHQLSQGAGAWEVRPGAHTSYFRLVDTVVPAGSGAEKDFFDGIDTTLPGLATRLGAEESAVPFLRPALTAIAAKIDEATSAADSAPEAAADPLLASLATLEELLPRLSSAPLSAPAKADLLLNLQTKREQLQTAAALALGLELKATVDAAPATTPQDVFVAVPGQPVTLTVKFVNHGTRPVQFLGLDSALPKGWTVPGVSENPKPLPAGGEISFHYQVSAPAAAELTRPYWHRNDPQEDAIYQIDEPQYATLPFPPPPVRLRARYRVDGGAAGAVTATPVVAFLDPDKGVHEMPLAVGPALSVTVSPATLVIPRGGSRSTTIEVAVQKNVATAIHGTVELLAPAGWKVEPATITLDLKPEARHTIVHFRLTPQNVSAGRVTINAKVTAGGKTYSEGYTVITRPDLDTLFYYQPARVSVSVIDVNLPDGPGFKIGYIMGAGDDIPTVLQQLGLSVTEITEQELASGDLQRYGTIVLGIRAYGTREDVRKYNGRLLDYVRAGGTLLVQYESDIKTFHDGNFTPYPLQLSHDRVTIEEAPVEILRPESPLFHHPNSITAADFQGWVQERGLYFANEWDPHFEPLLQSNDPSEAPLKGGMLQASYGKGTYIYTGYSFFRQLPAGVQGAIRLFVNLVSAGHEAVYDRIQGVAPPNH